MLFLQLFTNIFFFVNSQAYNGIVLFILILSNHFHDDLPSYWSYYLSQPIHFEFMFLYKRILLHSQYKWIIQVRHILTWGAYIIQHIVHAHEVLSYSSFFNRTFTKIYIKVFCFSFWRSSLWVVCKGWNSWTKNKQEWQSFSVFFATVSSQLGIRSILFELRSASFTK